MPDPLAIIQAETGTIRLAAPRDKYSTQVRDLQHPEPQVVGGLRPDYTGTGYVDFGNDPGDLVRYQISAPAAGTYDLLIRYADRGGRTLDLTVNGSARQSVGFAATDADGSGPAGNFDSWGYAVVQVNLAAGANTVALIMPAGATAGPNIDRLELYNPGEAPAPAVDTTADYGHNLKLAAPTGNLNQTEASSLGLHLTGRDADVTRVTLQLDADGPLIDVTGQISSKGHLVIDATPLGAGTHQARIIVTDNDGNTAETSTSFTVVDTRPQPIMLEAEDPAAATILDTGTGTSGSITRVSSQHAGASGGKYVDVGTDSGDGLEWHFDAPRSGRYNVTFRYANGDTSSDRPMRISVNGDTSGLIEFPSGGKSSWTTWRTVTVQLDLVEGRNTLNMTVPADAGRGGPNIDSALIEYVADGVARPADAQTFPDVVAINFEPSDAKLPSDYVTPEFHVSDQGGAFGVRDNGMSYGWVAVSSGRVTHTGSALPADQASYNAADLTASDLFRTSAAFEVEGVAGTERAWEMALANGTYQVRLSVGSSSPPANALWRVNVEGRAFLSGIVPDPAAGATSTVVTRIVTVTDGRLTIDSLGGVNTSLQWLEVERVPDLTPGDTNPAQNDYSAFVDIRAATSAGQVSLATANGTIPTGIDPTSDFVVGIRINDPDHRGPNITYSDHIRLIETVSGREIPITVQTTGGADSLTIRPAVTLQGNTSYTLLVDDVLDLGSSTDPLEALREFADASATFVTGEAPAGQPTQVAFTDRLLLDGFGDGAAGFTSIEFGPDGRLYVATIMGEIIRWDLRADGTIDPASREALVSDYFAQGDERRGIIGLTFDPENPNVIWISDNYPIPREGKAHLTPEFSGRITRITLGADGSLENATPETYLTGLPRSGGDHVTNSLEFRANPDAGQPGEPNYLLYVTQGSNTAGGAADSAWGLRPERLLSAAVLEIDRSRTAPPGGFDVRTEPIGPTDDPATTFPSDQFNENGTYPGSYDPFAPDAVLRIFATGIRNGYDLVWHSNGNLYVPANGTAAGANSPDDPSTPVDETATSSPNQPDYLFRVEEGGYYGHPNPLLDNYILNGGNPTSGVDPNEVGGNTYYPVGTMPDPNYRINDSYRVGYNLSPDGVIEYRSGVFGSSLQNAVVFTQFSSTDQFRYALIGENGEVTALRTLRRADGTAINSYVDPLDIIENPVTGQLYAITLNRGTGASQLILLNPDPQPAATATTTMQMAALSADVSDMMGTSSALVIDASQMTLAPTTDSIIRLAGDPSTHETSTRYDANGDGMNDGHDGEGYIDFGSLAGDSASFVADVATAGDYVVSVRVANGTTALRPMEVSSGGQTVQIADTRTGSFSAWKTVDVTLSLTAGENTISIGQVGTAGANIDSLTLTPVPQEPQGTADIRLDSRDPGIHEDRLHFSYITDPRWTDVPDRDFKEDATIRIHSQGDAPLEILGATIKGPYMLADPAALQGLVIPAGDYVDVKVLFNRSAYTQRGNLVDGVIDGTLTLQTNDPDSASVTVDLRGFCQPRPESGQEPNLNEMFDILGLGNHIEGLSYARGGEHSTLEFYSLFLPADETEVMTGYWKIADGYTSAQITQIAAYHGPGAATVSLHAPGKMGTTVKLMTPSAPDTQMMFPGMTGSEFATKSFTKATVPDWWSGPDVFAFRIGPASSDPKLNAIDAGLPTQEELDARYPGTYLGGDGTVRFADGSIIPDGQAIRTFQAVDENGVAIPDTYIVAMDYPGINNDFNDNVFIVSGIAPVYM